MAEALLRADDTTPLTSDDFVDVHLCFMLIGTNNVSTTVGSMADEVGAATFYGQTREVIETIVGWNPDCRFVIATLLWRDQYMSSIDALNAAILEIAAYYAIPVCDLRKISGISEFSESWALNDGLHPSANGYRRCLRPAVRGFLRTIDPVTVT